MLEIKAIDFNIGEAFGKIQKGIPSAIQPRMAKMVANKIFEGHDRLGLTFDKEKTIRKFLIQAIDKHTLPTLSGWSETFYDNYIYRGEDLMGIQPRKGKEQQVLFYKGYNYKKFRHPCVIEEDYVWDLENNKTRKDALVEKDFLIVDDKGVVRYLSEESFKLFEKSEKTFPIGYKIK